jgi:hypothetical protein
MAHFRQLAVKVDEHRGVTSDERDYVGFMHPDDYPGFSRQPTFIKRSNPK